MYITVIYEKCGEGAFIRDNTVHGQSELDLSEFLRKESMSDFKVTILCVGEGRVVVMVLCVGESVNEVCMEVCGCGDGCLGVGWVGG